MLRLRRGLNLIARGGLRLLGRDDLFALSLQERLDVKAPKVANPNVAERRLDMVGVELAVALDRARLDAGSFQPLKPHSRVLPDRRIRIARELLRFARFLDFVGEQSLGLISRGRRHPMAHACGVGKIDYPHIALRSLAFPDCRHVKTPAALRLCQRSKS
ncbi:MAG TPA: hypothetical protein VMV27_11545 [Candidatus Binataceae bacterium]|nr:hypothetical protein [Candidatus Binataceae bacterium]